VYEIAFNKSYFEIRFDPLNPLDPCSHPVIFVVSTQSVIISKVLNNQSIETFGRKRLGICLDFYSAFKNLITFVDRADSNY